MSDTVHYGTTGKPHPFHIVRPSPWPLISSLAGGLFAVGMVLFMHKTAVGGFLIGPWLVALGLLSIVGCMFFWWKNVVFESVGEKIHTPEAGKGFRYGMGLFIASEVMFFFAFFWAFFSSALFPAEGIWPPKGISVVNPMELPLLMTMILLLSGCAVNWAHDAALKGINSDLIKGTLLAVALGVVFSLFQMLEYSHVTFKFTDGIYPSTFYMATGFHGFHVIIGTIFLAVCVMRARKGHFTAERHFGFEAAAWYWHFVDVVWLFLFVAIYWWGGFGGHLEG
jgi:cytochrome c oxidase subunit III